ncbi:MAG: Exopolyphosphatase [Paracidovorax wautersii]|uniref:Exopolyphosphatase n=1 Tax=Paracidovorax wautersii TaxID=1177982 RepID=A0A7V8FMJ5_9BURK|nr:MAG: Exopolyphosphatase [Paracidovorax wautersii]
MQNGTRLAAVDLGSNSFRLEIGRYEHGQITRTDYLKETVRQGGGLDANRNLTPEAMQRGWDCLARFGERLAGFKPAQVRAVATQTLREARNRDAFLRRASELLGFPIDVVSGPEEARLIYQGVARLLPQSQERRLVVDVGGRSTELILGQEYAAHVTSSFRVGSVACSLKYFPEGLFTPQAFQMAEIAAQAVMDEAQITHDRQSWDVAYGASGTVGAVGDVLQALGWPEGLITREGLDDLVQRLIKAGSAERVRMDGLKPDRRAVIGGGVSVVRAVFDLLQIEEMQVAQGALRQGALYDLLDREQPETDVREATVGALSHKFAIDRHQAARVSSTAVALFRQVAPADEAIARDERTLRWAGQLHEIGCLIAHDYSHRHGAYILENTDAPGFALPELVQLAHLVRSQRGKPHKLALDLADDDALRPLVCLRLAILLCHARRDPRLDGIALRETGDGYVLAVPAAWRHQFPQSAHLLAEEAQAWQRCGITFALDEA